MQNLRQLFMNGADLHGTLPGVWGAQLPSLWEVQFINARLTGVSPMSRPRRCPGHACELHSRRRGLGGRPDSCRPKLCVADPACCRPATRHSTGQHEQGAACRSHQDPRLQLVAAGTLPSQWSNLTAFKRTGEASVCMPPVRLPLPDTPDFARALQQALVMSCHRAIAAWQEPLGQCTEPAWTTYSRSR